MTSPETGAQASADAEVLRLDGITKRFGEVTANEDVSLTLRAGEIVALLGENGAGKTTLMNILFGHYAADAGEVRVMGRRLPPGQPRAAIEAGVGMVHQHFTLADALTVQENVTLGTRPWWRPGGRAAARARIEDLARDYGLQVDPDAAIADLTVGQRQRVEILKALYGDARVLILDEPTAVLTPQEARALFDTLRRATARGLAVILISHKLHEVMATADRIVVLRHGRVVGERATAATDPADLARLMVGADIAEPKAMPAEPGEVLLRLDAVSTPPGATQGAALDRASLDLRAGQIKGIAGVSGNGQSALAGLLEGLIRPASGTLTLGNAAPADWSPRIAVAAGIGRIPEDRHHTGTIADFTLTENAILETYRDAPFARGPLIDWSAARAHAEDLIEANDVRCPGPDAAIRLLSGGNMQKLILARALHGAPRIILANQPVRGLDIGAVTYLQSRLLAARDAGAAILLISEDLDEILALSDVIHTIHAGRLSPPVPRERAEVEALGLAMAGGGADAA
ncbi:ABC transporter ATP-binding protein [Jannaschia aquimarina]|uniref:RbsA_3 protein n=1 Tax=Jannaschia aquimarina TaxID=935700 RepID=A0A0D1CJJ8_9RHOB|nr:ABC transporter ATP-binding protein [Jannaschia aquimarina]KIT14862.1 Ribose import ATP-binding protein RbsA [Jannaschia aquimarina]SNS57802.1 nucleoside ABC transporter ATP-binding protein [Jannaschia aquimarina]